MGNFFTDWDATNKFKPADLNFTFDEFDEALSYMHNQIMHCDGTIEYDKTTGVLSWDDTIRVIFNIANGNCVENTIVAGNVTLLDNEFAYVDLSETDGQAVSIAKAAVTTDDTSNFLAFNRFILGYRNPDSDNFYPVGLRSILGDASNAHARLHDIDSTDDHNGVSGAIEDNLISFDANGLPKDSGYVTPLPVDFGGTYRGVFAASVVIMRLPMVRTITFPASMTGSQGVLGTATTAQTDFDLQKNAVSFGTMRFAAAATTATFIAASPTSFSAGDVLTVVAPGTPDVTAADLGFLLAGTY